MNEDFTVEQANQLVALLTGETQPATEPTWWQKLQMKVGYHLGYAIVKVAPVIAVIETAVTKVVDFVKRVTSYVPKTTIMTKHCGIAFLVYALCYLTLVSEGAAVALGVIAVIHAYVLLFMAVAFPYMIGRDLYRHYSN
jgi:uncharacterized protein YacL